MGAVAAWRQRAYTPPLWEPRVRPLYHPRRVLVLSWKNKEVFNAELFHRAMRISSSDKKRGWTTRHLFRFNSDNRASVDRPRSRPSLSQGPTELEELLIIRGRSVSIWWTPAHKGVEGNEVVNFYVK